jgi:hypothetical protein
MWAGFPSDTAPILRGKSQRNDIDQQEIRRTTFTMSPRAKPHPYRINYHRNGTMLQVGINFMT